MKLLAKAASMVLDYTYETCNLLFLVIMFNFQLIYWKWKHANPFLWINSPRFSSFCLWLLHIFNNGFLLDDTCYFFFQIAVWRLAFQYSMLLWNWKVNVFIFLSWKVNYLMCRSCMQSHALTFIMLLVRISGRLLGATVLHLKGKCA